MNLINGLPAHAMLVHVVVVLVPLTAVLLLAVVFWPVARRHLSVLTAVVAGVALLSVPVTTEAGDWLEHHVTPSALVRAHAHLGDTMLPWAIGLFLVTAAIAVREALASRAAPDSRPDHPGAARAPVIAPAPERREGLGGRPASIVLAVLAVVVAVGSVVTVYRIGDSGARAAWTGHFSQQANPPHARTPPS